MELTLSKTEVQPLNLSRNENKIVISPDHWTNDNTKNAKHLISDNFITIPCCKPSR